ncbi:hypothetical protein CBL_02753 [Carabus blaptoides fortunei]
MAVSIHSLEQQPDLGGVAKWFGGAKIALKRCNLYDGYYGRDGFVHTGGQSVTSIPAPEPRIISGSYQRERSASSRRASVLHWNHWPRYIDSIKLCVDMELGDRRMGPLCCTAGVRRRLTEKPLVITSPRIWT